MKPGRVIPFLVRTAVLVGLGVWLSRRLDRDALLAAIGTGLERWPLLLAGLAYTCWAMVLGAARWYAVLRRLGLPQHRFRDAVRWVWIGQFFNAFLPGACGGDFVRGWSVARRAPAGARAEAAVSVLIDRLAGLWVLLVWSSGALLLTQPWRGGGPWNTVSRLVLPAGGLALTAPLLLWFFPSNLSERLHPLAGRVHRAFRTCIASVGATAVILLGSLGNMAVLTLAAWYFVAAIGASIELSDMFVLFPVITILASVPLTPGALGLRENLFAVLGPLFLLPPEQGVVVSLLVYLSGLVVGLAGGALFVLESQRSGKSLRASLGDITRQA